MKAATREYIRPREGHVLLASVGWASTLGWPMTDIERKRRIAYAIRSAREERGLSRPQLAERVGVGRSAVSDWENAETLPSLLNLGPLCDALEVSADLFAHPPEIPVSPVREYLLEAQRVLDGEEAGTHDARPNDGDARARAAARGR